MIDLHSHLLPGVDDGCRTLAESLDLARAYVENGVAKVAVTPHIREGMFDNRAEDLRALAAAFQETLAENRIPLEIRPWAEYFYNDSLIAQADAPAGFLTLGGFGRHLLVEFSPHAKPLNLKAIVFRLKVNGLTPVMAHPERYAFIGDSLEWAEGLADGGMLLQGTLAAISGWWGSAASRRLKRLLDARLIHLVSSDLHKARHAGRIFGAARDRLKEWVGPARLERLLHENPARLFSGEAVDSPG